MTARRAFDGTVVVVTGGSSGIGRSAAIELARRGAWVALAARGEDGLEATQRRCERLGGVVTTHLTDVRDQGAVDALAGETIERFGRIDAWVNSAGVIAYGRFDAIPAEVYRRVIETNLFGQINGARAVMPHFRARRRGVLVNMSSVWGIVPSPYVSAYVVSKFGVRAFTESLRQELSLEPDMRDVHVCAVVPQSVRTPIFGHSANYLGRRIRPVPPVVDVDRAARAVVHAIECPRKTRHNVGSLAYGAELAQALVPGLVRTATPRLVRSLAVGREPAPKGPGNVLEPAPEQPLARSVWRR